MPALLPGAVFRVWERERITAAGTPFSRVRPAESLTPIAEALPVLPVLLSGPPSPTADAAPPWRVLRASDAADPNDVRAFLTRLGLELSRTLAPSVHFLHIFGEPTGAWESITWENGTETERSGSDEGENSQTTTPLTKRGFPFLRLAAPPIPSSAVAWARRRGLPMDRVPVGTKRSVRVVDFETVAGLERKNLLVENAPVWYRFRDSPPASSQATVAQ